MVKSRAYSVNSIPNSSPIFVAENSIEHKELDPKYVRVLGTVAPSSEAMSVIYSPPESPSQFPQSGYIATNNQPKEKSEGFAIQLDDVFLVSGPTEYMDGTNKKYEIVFKIVNSEKLPIKSILIRTTEA